MPPIDQSQTNASRPGYWRSLEELSRGDQSRAAEDEFASPERLWTPPAVSRRRMLQLLGASMALAGMAGCGRQPEEHIVPYVRMPEHLVPGTPDYYATAVPIGGYAHGLVAETHEGRPTKLEGNPDHPATVGNCDSVSQAFVLSLYDPDRSSTVRSRDGISSYGEFLGDLQRYQGRWDSSGGEGLAFLTGTITSPSEQARMDALARRWPRARWFVHEPVSRSGVYRGTQWLFGQPLEPVYRFDRARVVVSLDADFMQAQPGFVRYARDYMDQRRAPSPGDTLARLYVVESSPTVTGASADHWRGLAYHDIEAATRQIARALGVAVEAPARPELPETWVSGLVRDLRRNGRQALVVPGDQQPAAVHAMAHGINQQLGSLGHAVELIEPVANGPLADGLVALTAAMDRGEVTNLIVLGTNPVYTAPADLQFGERLARLPWSVHWGEYADETGQLASWHVPAAHPLESWGDLAAYDGTVSLMQPTIRPLHGGKTALQLWHAIERGVDEPARQLLVAYWQDRYAGQDFRAFWHQALRAGVVPDTGHTPARVTPVEDWQGNLTAPSKTAPAPLSLQFRPDPALWDGRHANNAWLQELPRPLTTLTWHNALMIPPALATQQGLQQGDLVALETRHGRVEVPVYVLPRQPEGTVTLSLGHGRAAGGSVAEGIGTNAYPLRGSGDGWSVAATLEPTGRHRELAAVQLHNAMEGRDLIRAAPASRYQEHPEFAQSHHKAISLYEEPSPVEGTGGPDEQAWGMVIDLSSCMGCNACVTGCQAENNIPVVGPEEVARGHDLHWIRVDRYFSGTPESPGITFQPVPCMHCENAPCEYVCPVGATQHSADGLNQMIYQRCIGTRYCSQNCPYKVRRFNWFDYTSTDAAYPAEPAVQNPDVTVRTRGVMEKCTYCVQRINEVRRTAERENRPIADGELQTACQQACPTNAIRFGNLNDADAGVSQWKAMPLNYGLLEHLNTRPRTTYLAAVHNPNPDLTGEGEG